MRYLGVDVFETKDLGLLRVASKADWGGGVGAFVSAAGREGGRSSSSETFASHCSLVDV